MRFIIIIIFFVSTQIALANDTTRIVQVLSEYRSVILKDNLNAIDSLQDLKEKWRALGYEDEAINKVIGGIHKNYVIDGMSFKLVRGLSKMDDYIKPLVELTTESDFNIIKNNSDFIELISSGLVEEQAPYKLKMNLVEEILSYQIRDSMVIGEIGAGSGIFSLFLALIYDDLVLYVNDIDLFALDYFENKIKKWDIRNNKIRIVNGQKKKTYLEGKYIDKIIIRNSFHHFKKKEKMLASIHASLAGNGVLYVNEPPLRKESDLLKCHLLMEQKEIVKSLENEYFKIKSIQEIGDDIILEMTRNNNKNQ